MSVESVRKEIEEKGYGFRFIQFEESTATVELAAKALKTQPENIVKSLAIRLKEKDILVLCSGLRKLDNKKFKEVFKEKPRFIQAEDLIDAVGHPVGGVTPFGLSKDLEVYIDQSLRGLEFVYPAGGSPSSCIEIHMDTLQDIFLKKFIDVSR